MTTRYLAAFALVAALQTGCRAGEPYNADVAVVHMLGKDEALNKLQTTLKQAAAPQVMPNSVDVTNEYYFYQALDIAMYGRGFVAKKVYFKEVDAVEMWESRGHTYVKLLGPSGKKVDQLKWSSGVDAKLFADLVMSFKANPNIGDDSGPKKKKQKPEPEEDEEEAPIEDKAATEANNGA